MARKKEKIKMEPIKLAGETTAQCQLRLLAQINLSTNNLINARCNVANCETTLKYWKDRLFRIDQGCEFTS